MERLKTPAGRLATVFYKADPEKFLRNAGVGSDAEKGSTDNDTPPITKHNTKQSDRSRNRVGDNGHTFAWSRLCLDIKTKDGEKRLLDNLSGWVKSGQMKALMGVSGAG